MLCQILRFTVQASKTISAPAFTQLRQKVFAAGAKSQYFGYSTQLANLAIPKDRHEITWIIQWPSSQSLSTEPDLVAELGSLAQGEPTNISVEMDEAQLGQWNTAFESPVTEIVAMRLTEKAPLAEKSFAASVHKSFTDCYRMLGFVDGYWAYALNTNEPRGQALDLGSARIQEQDRRLAIYGLGWESIELHQDASMGEAFAEEMSKLGPWLESDSGAWYAYLRKHSNE